MLKHVGRNLNAEVYLAIWAAEKGCAVDYTGKSLRYFWVAAKVRIDTKPSHAVSQEETGQVRFNLLKQRVHLVVELLNCKAVDAAARREAEPFEIDQVDVKSIERKMDCCFKKYILALGKTMNHGEGSVLLLLGNVGNLGAECVHIRLGSGRAWRIVPPEFNFVSQQELPLLKKLEHIKLCGVVVNFENTQVLTIALDSQVL